MAWYDQLGRKIGNVLEDTPIVGGVYQGAKNALRDIPFVGDVLGLDSSYDQARDAATGYLGNARGEVSKGMTEARGYLDPYTGIGNQARDRLAQGMANGAYSPAQFSYSGEMPSYSYAGRQPVYQERGNLQGFQGQRATNLSSNQLQQDPGYQYRQQAMTQELNRRAAAGGIPGGFSGSGAMRGAASLIGDLASQEYGAALDRKRYIDETNYNRGRSEEQDFYNRGLSTYGINRDAEADMYNRGLRSYDIASNREREQYGRGVQQYGLESQRLQDIYGRERDLTGMGYTAAKDLAGLRGTEGQLLSDIYREQAEMDSSARMGEAGSKNKFFGDAAEAAVDLYGAGFFG